MLSMYIDTTKTFYDEIIFSKVRAKFLTVFIVERLKTWKKISLVSLFIQKIYKTLFMNTLMLNLFHGPF